MKKNFPPAAAPSLVFSVVLVVCTNGVWAQDRIFRCGNEYTNNAATAKDRGCKVVEGGNVTVIQGTKPAPARGATDSGAKLPTSPSSAPRVDANDQKARDADARSILEAELRKSQDRLKQLRAEYNDGAPQRNALDLRNPQQYMERTAALKESVARAESDVGGIQREIERLGVSK